MGDTCARILFSAILFLSNLDIDHDENRKSFSIGIDRATDQ